VTWDELLARCLAKPGAWRDEPWDGDVVVKVSSKIFAFLGSESASAVGVKCASTREAADEWLLRYPDDVAVMAYIGRSGWNTLRIGGAIPDDELLEAIDSSYDTVVSKLPKKDRPAHDRPHDSCHGDVVTARVGSGGISVRPLAHDSDKRGIRAGTGAGRQRPAAGDRLARGAQELRPR
jgi:predicted DNA-binding protein (MmcQ/YjbR family)